MSVEHTWQNAGTGVELNKKKAKKTNKKPQKVNGNCPKVIECMSEHLCVLASNKYTSWQSKPIWENKESAESNQGGEKV